MAITTLRPDASSAADYTSTPAGTAAHVILARTVAAGTATTAEFIQRTSSNQTKTARIQFGTTTLASNQIVSRVRLRVNASTTNKGANMTFAIGYRRSNGVSVWGPELQLAGRKASQNYEGPWSDVKPGGTGAWGQTELDAVEVQILDAARKSGQRGKTHLLYVDADIITQGTVTISSPTGTITDTSRPTVEWTFTEPEGVSQAFYEVRIYTDAVVDSAGFTTLDTETYPPVWQSGEVRSSANLQRVGVSLENDDYHAYVRAARSVANNPFWSAWDSEEFTMGLTLPATPTVSATHSTTTGAVTVESTLTALGTAYSSRTVEVQRSIDEVVWTTLDAGSSFGTAAGTASYVDYFAPRGGSAYYRARQVAILSDETIPSAYGSAAVNVVNDGTWWFKPVDSIAKSFGSVNVQPGFSEQFEEQATVFSPIGRESNVVISAGLTGRSGSFSITTVGETEWADLEDVLEEVGPVYVEAPTGESLTVRFLRRQWQTGGLSANAVREVQVDWVEV